MGEKRSNADCGENSELGRKRVKMRDLDTVLRSEGIDTHYPKSTELVHTNNHFEKDKSKETTNSNIAQYQCLDLNAKVCANKSSSSRKDDLDFATSRCFGWDLNSNDVPNALGQDAFYAFKSHELLKSGDASECGSSTGPVEEKDPMRVWKEMKQNGFLSSSHGGIPVPKPRGRKSKNEVLKKKMEIAKREQVDRFAKIAAPSGLLSELNPGIINHVRNSKQVHSIIEALVRSEKQENRHSGGKQAVSTKSGTKEITDTDLEDASVLGMKQPGHAHEDGSLSTLAWSQQTSGCPEWLSKSVHLNSYHAGKDGELSKVEKKISGQTTCPLQSNQESGNDILALKLSSSTTMALENTSSLSNAESANLTNVSSLSVKAANVASQWLELLHQDIKGRLAALRRSKKRVQSVIHTELQFLMSREFSCNQENDPYVMKNSATGCSDSANADAHRARWSALFDQMDKALSEEEIQLETWLNQVKEMQLHCERGLQHHHYSASHDSRLEEADMSERELAVTAAAASIYSTCNFLLSKENRPCF
ncbi:uncharacterized protein LOC130769807 [Actinidia eriantha]|uniref:uncharacterized protein LOC130769807 n=1 Tax=Actinidia eriantha TaxID=165200 RepID=UPI0025881393|nr:uncharacterized protein LOC130769807 [Actinidia eriantha]